MHAKTAKKTRIKDTKENESYSESQSSILNPQFSILK
jgi:hypothetical protein